MTFRPSDDVLDEVANGQQPPMPVDQYNVGNQDEEHHLFHSESDSDNQVTSYEEPENQVMIDIPTEEVKAPDLSELLKNSGGDDSNNNEEKTSTTENQNIENTQQPQASQDVSSSIETESRNISQSTESLNDVQNTEITNNTENVESTNNIQNTESNLENENKQEVVIETAQTQNLNQITIEQPDYVDSDKMPDIERTKLVSSIDGAINSNLDFLVDKGWIDVVLKYKKVNRLFFRWGLFTLALIIGVVGGALLQVKASSPENIQMINDDSIENINKWNTNTPDIELGKLVESGVNIDVIVPYGSASIKGTTFQTKSNLISYKGIILPQLASIDYKSDDFISMDDFDNQKVGRADLKQLINSLIKNSYIYKNTSNLPNVSDFRWNGKLFQGKLKDGFNLSCIDNEKISDLVCDRFIDIFYKYGKYYQLSSNTSEFNYSYEISELTKTLVKNNKDAEPICDMINDYVLHAGLNSDNFDAVFKFCPLNDYDYYKRLVSFIELENSLGQPELSNKVFENPDLNAYKLLSALQNVYKFLGGTSFNENYIKSYLDFVQTLIDKDKGQNKYIAPIYKDLMYVFNSDELYPFLIKNSYTSLKLQVDQINNGNSLYKHESLLNQLTTTGLEIKDSEYTKIEIVERTIDDIFSPYYAMTDRLKVRRAVSNSEDTLNVQTELFTDKILGVTEGETLKLTVILHRKNNSLYVNSIKVANQPKFTDILSMYASGGNISFPEMLSYIDEQVGMWYELEPEETEPQPTFCEQIQEREDIAIYTCNDSSISLYKGDIEYNFNLINGIIDSYTIGDEKLDKLVKEKLSGTMFTKDNTQIIIMSIIDFGVESSTDDNLQKKVDINDQFRIHFKLIPDDIHDIKGNPDEFLVDLSLGEIKLQAHYNVNTHLMTKVSYVNCGKTLEIRGLTIAINTENESQLIEILNNPKVFLIKANQSAYKKYQKMCEDPKAEEKKK